MPRAPELDTTAVGATSLPVMANTPEKGGEEEEYVCALESHVASEDDADGFKNVAIADSALEFV